MIGALRYEMVRIRTISSSYWLSALALLLTAGITTVMAFKIDSTTVANMGIADVTTWMVTGGASGPLIPVLGPLFFAVLGAMGMGNEFRYGTAKATLTALPNRYQVIAAKAIVLAVWVFVVAVLTLLVDVVIVQLVVAHPTLTSSVWRPVIDYVALSLGYAFAGIGVAAVLRSQVGAIVTVLLWPLLIEPVAGGVMQVITMTTHTNLSTIYNLLPATAGRRVIYAPYDLLSGDSPGLHIWGITQSTLVFWVAIAGLAALGVASFVRRDA